MPEALRTEVSGLGTASFILGGLPGSSYPPDGFISMINRRASEYADNTNKSNRTPALLDPQDMKLVSEDGRPSETTHAGRHMEI
jgi:hypothetical protein